MIPSILLDFIHSFSNVKLNTEFCPAISSAKASIYKTIMEYHKVSAKKSLHTPDLMIQEICEHAAKILLKPDGYYIHGGNVPLPNENRGDPFKTQFNFRASWLRTASLCLDSTQEEVMQILPYLLYCYTLNSSKNKIDCFDPQKGFTKFRKSFLEIFVSMKLAPGTEYKNLRRNAKSLRNYFFSSKPILFDIEEHDHVDDGQEAKELSTEASNIFDAMVTGIPPEDMHPLEETLDKRFSLSQLDLQSQKELDCVYGQLCIAKKEKLASLKFHQEEIVRFYEMCRRFLAFVNACVALQDKCKSPINLSLSFVLFCKTMTVVCRSDAKHKSLFNPPRWNDIVADEFRSELESLSEWIPESESIPPNCCIKFPHEDYDQKLLRILRCCNVYNLAYESKCQLLDLLGNP